MPTAYVVFDGDKDMWAYRFMRGWTANERVDFELDDAHELGSQITDRASEETIKRRLRSRMARSDVILVLVGESTRYLYRFVRWELEFARELGLPIVVVNLNGLRECDEDRCPPIIRDATAVHVPFKAKIIAYALEHFPDEYAERDEDDDGPRYYPPSVYRKLGLG